jgi:MFS family permease
MPNKTQFALIAALTSFAFWIPVFTLFTQLKGISAAESLLIISIYSFAVVLLEYPTGIFGDFLSHKMSTLMGFCINALSMIFISFSPNYGVLLASTVFSALGVTLISGSDDSYRYHILGDSYKKDYPFIKTVGTVATLFGIALGPVLFSLHPHLPFVANGLSFFIATVILYLMPRENNTIKNAEHAHSNLFSLALYAVKTVVSDKVLFLMLLGSGFIGMIAVNMKWVYPTLFDQVHIHSTHWGYLISILFLGKMFGTILFRKLSSRSSRTPVIFGLLVISVVSWGFVTNPVIMIPVLFIQFLFVGYIETVIELFIQQRANSSVRAATLSLGSLIKRLLSGLQISLLSYLLGLNLFPLFGVLTAILVTVSFYAYVVSKNSQNTDN